MWSNTAIWGRKKKIKQASKIYFSAGSFVTLAKTGAFNIEVGKQTGFLWNSRQDGTEFLLLRFWAGIYNCRRLHFMSEIALNVLDILTNESDLYKCGGAEYYWWQIGWVVVVILVGKFDELKHFIAQQLFIVDCKKKSLKIHFWNPEINTRRPSKG